MSSTPALRKPTATNGDLANTPFAEVLLGLARDRFDGAIEFERDQARKRILWQRGLPVMAESNLPGESLATALLDRSLIDRAQHAKIVDASRRARAVNEGAAVLALHCVDPVELVATLRGLVRRRILECFEWTQGRFREIGELDVPQDAAALRCDPVSVSLEGIAIHWSPSRVREALRDVAHRYPHPTPATANLIGRLAADPDTLARCEDLDGTRAMEEVLSNASPVAWSAALVLERIGAWTLRDEPWVPEGDQEEIAPEASLPEYEIVIGSSGDPTELKRAGQPEDVTPQAASDGNAETDAFRAEVEALHEKLEELDHYAILGVDEKAGVGAIKRAYFKAAKRFHPDTLVRVGLDDVKTQAKELFTRIAAAYEVLKDPVQRRDYDGSRERGGDDLDASRLIQAESLFRKGEIMIGAGNFSGALEFLQPAVELWPEESEYQSALGWALFRKAAPDLGAARTHLELAIKQRPNNAEAHHRLSLVLRALEDYKGADASMARAKVLDPKL